jgi:hypothetical protein
LGARTQGTLGLGKNDVDLVIEVEYRLEPRVGGKTKQLMIAPWFDASGTALTKMLSLLLNVAMERSRIAFMIC